MYSEEYTGHRGVGRGVGQGGGKKLLVKGSKKYNTESYENCLKTAPKNLKLCRKGYCTAKHIFDVYPSAYANGYATSVCKGVKPDIYGELKENKKYTSKFKNSAKNNSLDRWYKEKWVNVCEKGSGPGGYAVCGSGKGLDDLKNYPYCRAYYKLPGTTVVTAQELKKEEIEKMCKKKRSLEQGVDGKPTRVYLNKNRLVGGNVSVKIPKKISKTASIGNTLINNGFSGGTETGWNRGIQLERDDTISVSDLADMRTWFARHGPDAKNGGTSYQGFCKWVQDGSPMNTGFKKYRGAVSWLIWGGDDVYKWLKSDKIMNLLKNITQREN